MQYAPRQCLAFLTRRPVGREVLGKRQWIHHLQEVKCALVQYVFHACSGFTGSADGFDRHAAQTEPNAVSPGVPSDLAANGRGGTADHRARELDYGADGQLSAGQFQIGQRRDIPERPTATCAGGVPLDRTRLVEQSGGGNGRRVAAAHEIERGLDRLQEYDVLANFAPDRDNNPNDQRD